MVFYCNSRQFRTVVSTLFVIVGMCTHKKFIRRSIIENFLVKNHIIKSNPTTTAAAQLLCEKKKHEQNCVRNCIYWILSFVIKSNKCQLCVDMTHAHTHLQMGVFNATAYSVKVKVACNVQLNAFRLFIYAQQVITLHYDCCCCCALLLYITFMLLFLSVWGKLKLNKRYGKYITKQTTSVNTELQIYIYKHTRIYIHIHI